MTDKMFADLICRGLIEVCAGLVKVIRAFERRYDVPEHKIPAMEKPADNPSIQASPSVPVAGPTQNP